MPATIAAISTPNAVGGIAVIRISGDDAIAIADSIFKSVSGQKLAEKKGYTAAFGKIFNGDDFIDNGVATVFRTPHSYTGEDVVEISCHGGSYVSREVLRAALKNGALLAGPGEFTKRAFLNGKMDLTEAEAVADLIEAKSSQAYNAAKAGYNGALSEKISALKKRLISIAAHLDAWADYPEEDLIPVDEQELDTDLNKCLNDLGTLISTFDAGRLIREGIDTVIVGKPNVGKSTLMNLLSGYGRSIVTDIAGTTRDVVEESVTIDGIMLRLSDTAGIRETADTVEKIGVNLAIDRIDTAALTIAVFDSSAELDGDDYKLIDKLKGKKAIAVINKNDLPSLINKAYIENAFSQIVYISALDNTSVKKLSEEIKEAVAINKLDCSSAIIATERQREAACRAENSVAEAISALECGMTLDAVTVMTEDAVSALAELTGERVTDEVVNSVFSHFCVGK